MAKPWKTLDSVPTAEGDLKLLERGEGDFMITIAGRVLMTSRSNRSEQELARQACLDLDVPSPRILVGGLGLGFTLRATLDVCPPAASITVCEITPAVVEWCRGPLSKLTGHALDDLRVRVELRDVAKVIRQAAGSGPEGRFDVIMLDLYEGPNESRSGEGMPYYGREALDRTRAALHPGGVFAVWSEAHDTAFEKRLREARFQVERRRPKSGHRYVIYLARREGAVSSRSKRRG